MSLGLGYFIQIFFVLALILVLFYAGNFVMNFVPGRKIKNRRMDVVEYLPLQPNVGLYMVKIDGDEFLVTVSNKVIQHVLPHAKKDFSQELKKKSVSRRTP